MAARVSEPDLIERHNNSGHRHSGILIHGQWRRTVLLAAVSALALALGGCEVLNVAGANSGSKQDLKVSLAPSSNPVTVDSVGRGDRFAKLAAAQHPKILATYGGNYADPKLERMVARVVGRLTFNSNDPGQTYRVTILNSPSVNAFALPGGYVYVTRGLLALANDSAELAAVISHEMAHVTARHGQQRQQLEADASIAARVVSEVLQDDEAGRQAAIRGKLRLAQFTRNQELEADAIGIKAAGAEGFDAYAAGRFLNAMGAYTSYRTAATDDDMSLDFLASHPSTPQRVELANRHASSARPAPATATGMHTLPVLMGCCSVTARKKAMFAVRISCTRNWASPIRFPPVLTPRTTRTRSCHPDRGKSPSASTRSSCPAALRLTTM